MWRTGTTIFVAIVFAFSATPSSSQADRRHHSVSVQGATFHLHEASALARALLGENLPLNDHQRLALLTVDLDPGWKTYWRLPGRFGLAPQFDWTASRNVLETDHVFPAPTLFDEAGGRSIGYDEPTVWPIIVTLESNQSATSLVLDLHLGLCEQLCLPTQVALNITMPSGDERQSDGPIAVDAPSNVEPSPASLLALKAALPTAYEGQISPLRRHGALSVRLAGDGSVSQDAFVIAENADGDHSLLLPEATDARIYTGAWRWSSSPQRVTLIEPKQASFVVDLIPASSTN